MYTFFKLSSLDQDDESDRAKHLDTPLGSSKTPPESGAGIYSNWFLHFCEYSFVYLQSLSPLQTFVAGFLTSTT